MKVGFFMSNFLLYFIQDEIRQPMTSGLFCAVADPRSYVWYFVGLWPCCVRFNSW